MIQTIFITALFVIGVKAVINGFFEFFGIEINQIYHWAQDDPRKTWQQFIMRPTIYCNVCMSSFWGTIGYILASTTFNTFEWILTCFSCAAIITIFNKIPDA